MIFRVLFVFFFVGSILAPVEAHMPSPVYRPNDFKNSELLQRLIEAQLREEQLRKEQMKGLVINHFDSYAY